MDSDGTTILKWRQLITGIIFCYFVTVTQHCQDQTYSGRAYKFFTTSKLRSLAQTDCEGFGMRLVVITMASEFAHWQSYFGTNYPMNQIWVGATFSATDDVFYWDTGEVVSSSYLVTQPSGLADGTCLRFHTNQMLVPLDCGNIRGSLCQEVPEVTTEPSSTTTETTTTTEDAYTTEPPMITTTLEITTEGLTTPEEMTTDGLTTAADITTDGLTTPQETTTDGLTTSQEMTTAGLTTPVEITTDSLTTAQAETSADWTSVSLSASTANTTTSDDDCLCSCDPSLLTADPQLIDEIVQNEVARIRKELYIDKSTLSKSIRKKTSATDDRPSAQNVGYMGVGMLTLAGLIKLS